MIGYVLLGLMAAFGLFCIIWALIGFLLPGSRRCTIVLVCRPKDESALLRRLLWLRETGLLHCAVCLSGRGLTERQRRHIRQKYPSIEFYDPDSPGE